MSMGHNWEGSDHPEKRTTARQRQEESGERHDSTAHFPSFIPVKKVGPADNRGHLAAGLVAKAPRKPETLSSKPASGAGSSLGDFDYKGTSTSMVDFRSDMLDIRNGLTSIENAPLDNEHDVDLYNQLLAQYEAVFEEDLSVRKVDPVRADADGTGSAL
ncbi:hypothetical protein HPB52_022682 [Rhipicephalus sanguineus]|uniref:Uncharacterized protein n=1 Tax=Rhipicephalus sanguineus TaxID=34632 RepID=A0A9D4SZ94_RHISA|nr:hypothetical protein HPB52_022682 [Rhipicephalus sanguineus]